MTSEHTAAQHTAPPVAGSPEPEGLVSAEVLATPDQKAHDSFTTFLRACEALGASLAVYRTAADLSRQQLAQRMRKSVSTIRRAETGQSLLTIDFWRTADHLLTTGGRLAAAWPHVAELKRIADLNRSASVAAHEIALGCLNPRDCLCFVAVAHWTQREVRALRLALRMGFYDWASAMQTDVEVVLGWESPRGPLPRLEEQLQLDELLERIALGGRARFRLLLAGPGQPPPPATN